MWITGQSAKKKELENEDFDFHMNRSFQLKNGPFILRAKPNNLQKEQDNEKLKILPIDLTL